MLVKGSKTVHIESLLVAWYGIMEYKMKIEHCEKAYWDRWNSEWICMVYDMPVRICCPCGQKALDKVKGDVVR